MTLRASDPGSATLDRRTGPPTGVSPPACRLLVAGPLPGGSDVLGGTVVSFAGLVELLRARGRVHVDVIDTSRPIHSVGRVGRTVAGVRAAGALLGQTVALIGSCDVVMLNASFRGLCAGGLPMWAVARLTSRPLVLRVFGGNLDVRYDSLGPVARWVLDRTLLRSDLLLLQTPDLHARFAPRARAKWFPTTREAVRPPVPARPVCRRFIYLGPVRADKGIAEALAASDELQHGATLDVYGPLMADVGEEWFERHPNARYGGVVQPRDVPAVLADHDALVFPSYYDGEGLPGAIVEAMQCGLPVIAARWRSVPWIVEHGASGLLVEPRSVPELVAAFHRLCDSPSVYAALAAGARRRGEEFRSEVWVARLEAWCIELRDERPRGRS